jgi:hypothetical protein
MFKLVNHRAGKIKLNNGKSLRRGLSITVEASVLVDVDLQRLISRGKVSVSRIEQTAPMVKFGVVESEKVRPVEELVVPDPVVPDPVVVEPAVEETNVEEPAKEPTIKRRSRRKPSTKKED